MRLANKSNFFLLNYDPDQSLWLYFQLGNVWLLFLRYILWERKIYVWKRTFHLFLIFKRQDKNLTSLEIIFFFFNFGISKSVRLLILLPLPLLLKYGFLISVIPRIYSLSLFKISNMQNLIQKVNQASLMWPDVLFKSQFKFWMQKLELGFSFPCVYKYSIGTTLILRKNYAHILLKMFYSKRV